VPFALSLTTLRQLSAFTIQLAINLEPLYAIALAVLFLGEARELDGRFFAGVAIVLGAVLGHAWQQSRQRRRTESLTDEPRSV
jgi:drug/metabolite transporter (DMT)-like permease